MGSVWGSAWALALPTRAAREDRVTLGDAEGRAPAAGRAPTRDGNSAADAAGASEWRGGYGAVVTAMIWTLPNVGSQSVVG